MNCAGQEDRRPPIYKHYARRYVGIKVCLPLAPFYVKKLNQNGGVPVPPFSFTAPSLSLAFLFTLAFSVPFAAFNRATAAATLPGPTSVNKI